MPVIKTELLNVEAKRAGSMAKRINMRIDNNSSVTLISLVEEDEARVDFRYTATYSGVGTIGIEGRLYFKGDARELHDKWSETGNMPDNIASEIHTSIMQTCMPVAVLLSREVKLPPPIPMPQVQVKGKQKKKRESSGIEVA
ncbi:MAG: hypothetical protein ACMUIG_00435 [Thermoplasmatota archaeon]